MQIPFLWSPHFSHAVFFGIGGLKPAKRESGPFLGPRRTARLTVFCRSIFSLRVSAVQRYAGACSSTHINGALATVTASERKASLCWKKKANRLLPLSAAFTPLPPSED